MDADRKLWISRAFRIGYMKAGGIARVGAGGDRPDRCSAIARLASQTKTEIKNKQQATQEHKQRGDK
jgi:hypothetical protein